MKKYITLLLLFCISIFYAQKRSYNIGVLYDKQTPEIATLLTRLQTQIKTVVGEDANIKFPASGLLVNNFNRTKAEENYQKLINGDTDIILAFGVLNNLVVGNQKKHVKPTILFGAINKDLLDLDFANQKSGIKNFTYLIESQSYIEDLKLLKELTNFKKVGIVIERGIANVLPVKELFNKELQKINSNYKIIAFNNVSDITNNLDGVDAVFMAGGFFLKDSEIKEIAQVFIDKKLPSISSIGVESVKLGMMSSNQSEETIDQIFRRISLTVESYINGTSLSKMDVYINYSPRLTINFNTARAVKVPIKYSLLSNTDFVGEIKNTTAEKNYNLLLVMEQVASNNLGLQASKKEVEISNQNIKSAKANYLPNVTASANGTYIDPRLAEISNGQNPEFSTNGSITLQQTIYNALASATITIQEKLKKAQEENYNTDVLDAVFNASNAYFNSLILKANLQIQMRNLDLTKRNLQIAEENFEVGQSGKSDVLRFRSELAQNTQAVVQAINQLNQGYIGLNQLLNNPLQMQIDVEDAELDKGLYKDYNYKEISLLLDDPTTREPFIEFLVEEAKKNAPELRSLNYNLEATERNIKLSGSDRFIPTVALQGQYNRSFSRHGAGSNAPVGFQLLDGNYNVGLNLSIPLFNQNLNNINKQTALIQKEQLEINRQNSELNIDSNVRNGVLNLVNQITNIELSKVSEQSAKEALELTQTSYKEGAVNFVQLIDAQNNYLNAQLASASAVYNFLINGLQLERNIGYYFLLHTKSDNDNFTSRFHQYLLKKN